MSERNNLFMIHSWEEAEIYARAIDLLKSRESSIADYSAPPWRPVPGPDSDVEASIRSRITTATAVVVVNTPGLHKRTMSSFEMKTAASMRKRIIVLQPHGDFLRPIPAALDGHVYRVAPWRSDVLGRAIRGEYPHDGRVFDIAETADVRTIVQTLSVGTGIVSLALIVRTAASFKGLVRELTDAGVRLQWSGKDTGQVVKGALTGAAVAGGVTALLTGDMESALWAAAGGCVAGAAIGATRAYRAALHGTGPVRVLALDASPIG